MAKIKKSPNQQQQPTEIETADNKDIMATTGIKLKYLSQGE